MDWCVNGMSFQQEEAKKAVAEQQDENANTIILQVDMHCEGCKAKVKKAIKKLKGIHILHIHTYIYMHTCIH